MVVTHLRYESILHFDEARFMGMPIHHPRVILPLFSKSHLYLSYRRLGYWLAWKIYLQKSNLSIWWPCSHLFFNRWRWCTEVSIFCFYLCWCLNWHLFRFMLCLDVKLSLTCAFGCQVDSLIADSKLQKIEESSPRIASVQQTIMAINALSKVCLFF